MKKTLITGACGFIGSHFTEYLVEQGHSVIAFDRYNSNNDHSWLNNSKYKDDIEFILGDIRDFDSVFHIMKKCFSCFHLAALIGIPYSYISPLGYLKTNVEGTYNILESSKILNIDQVIITSTSETYGTAKYTPIDENHPLLAQSPYAASKIAADQLSLSYYRSFNLPIKIVRPFNVYGPRQSNRAIIPTIINQCLSESKYIELGNINPTRDFTYVKDTCNAIEEVFKSDNFIGEISNIGSGKDISINLLSEKINKIIGTDKKIKYDKDRKRPNKSEVDRLVCDFNKISSFCNWTPNITLEDGLNKTIDWFKLNKKDNLDFSYHV